MQRKKNRLISYIIILITIILLICLFNKTFLKSTYQTKKNVLIPLPKLSFNLKETKSDTSIELEMVSFRNQEKIKSEIQDYIDSLNDEECPNGKYYDKYNDVTILEYSVKSMNFLNKIKLSFNIGNSCQKENAKNEK